MSPIMERSVGLAGEHLEVLDDRTECERGEEFEAADDDDDAGQQADEQKAVGREGAGRRRSFGLAASEPAIAITGTMMPKRQASMAMPSVVSYQGVLAVRPAKAEPLLPAADENA